MTSRRVIALRLVCSSHAGLYTGFYMQAAGRKLICELDGKMIVC
jgi:hypothetical protein